VDLRPIADVCGERLAEVRLWIADGRYPPPLDGDLVPEGYLDLVDEAGGIEALRAHVEGRYAIAADTFGAVAGPDEMDEAWDDFLAGEWMRRLLEPTPENVVREARLIDAVEVLLAAPVPAEWRWANRLEARADHLRALTRPGSPGHVLAEEALRTARRSPGRGTRPADGE
jgi:hypothetical protein